jgi:hypothetical protein
MVEWVLVCCLCLILLVAVLLAWWYPDVKTFSETPWNVFFIVLTPISLFLSVVFWFSTLQMQQRDALHHDRDSLTTLQTHLSKVEETMIQSSKICPNFVQSLTDDVGVDSDPDNLRVRLEKRYLSSRIFDLIELYIHERSVCCISPDRFSFWFRSPQLRKEWMQCKSRYPPPVQDFVQSLVDAK